MLLLDGNKTRRYYPYIVAVEEMWGRILDVDPHGLIHYCNSPPEGDRQVNGIILRSDASNYEDKIEAVVRQPCIWLKTTPRGFTMMGFVTLA